MARVLPQALRARKNQSGMIQQFISRNFDQVGDQKGGKSLTPDKEREFPAEGGIYQPKMATSLAKTLVI
jgi:hypothetical protein